MSRHNKSGISEIGNSLETTEAYQCKDFQNGQLTLPIFDYLNDYVDTAYAYYYNETKGSWNEKTIN